MVRIKCKTLRVGVLLVSLVSISTSPLPAQASGATLSGTVGDLSHAAVGHASVQINNSATEISQRSTNLQGSPRFRTYSPVATF